MLKTALAGFLALMSSFPALADSPLAKVAYLASGQLLLNGKPADLASIEAEFQRLAQQKGAVWYYRENAQAEPPPAAMSVIQLVTKYRLPISLSSKADFSDYVDANGRSQPRQR